MKKISNNLYSDFMWTFLTQLIILFTNFLLNKIFALRLGVDNFGILNIARRGATLIGFVMLAGQGLAIVKYLSFEKKNKDKSNLFSLILAGFIIISSISIGIILLMSIFKNGFTNMFFGTKTYMYLFWPMIIFALGSSLSTYIISVYRGIGKFTIFNYIQIISQTIIVILFIVLKSYRVNQILLIWAIIAILVPILFLSFSFLQQKKSYAIKIIDIKNNIKNLGKFGIPRIVGEFVQFSYYLIPLIIVNTKFGEVETSLFSASTAILQLFLPFFSYLGLILLPHTSKSISENKFYEVKRKINKGMLYYFILSGLLTIFGVVMTPLILKLLYSSDFINGTGIARVLLLSLAPRSIFLLLRNPIDAISDKPYNTYNLIISFGFMLILMFLGNSIYFIAFSFVCSDILLCLSSMCVWFKSGEILKKEGYYEKKN